MMLNKVLLFGFLLFLMFSCQSEIEVVELPSPKKSAYGAESKLSDKAQQYDKVLGALVGSAIGDAMGASTEMWHRSAIQKEYGYITGLTPAVRERSPEGTWDHNLISGSTTDDTRWKYLLGEYLIQYQGNLSPQNFANFITNYYQSIAKGLSDKDALESTDVLDVKIEKLNWIKEWARVSMAFQESPEAYQKAQHRFYGGEMSCAGMLYTPMFALVESNAEAAYLTAYEHALFDLGYARDISAMVAAMTQMAMQTSDLDSILNTIKFVDPLSYNDSRLIGRLSYSMANDGKEIVYQSLKIVKEDSVEIVVPKGYPGSKSDWVRQKYIYEALEKRQQMIAFHAGEIWQIFYTGLVFGDGDFEKTMQFIVNYGRDNDTVAAVAGTLLGARSGFSELPLDLREEVLRVNKEVMGIDMEDLAKRIVGGGIE